MHTHFVSFLLLLVKSIRGSSGSYEIVGTTSFEVMRMHEYLWMAMIRDYHFLSIDDLLL